MNLILGHPLAASRSTVTIADKPSNFEPATANDDDTTDYGASVSSTATASSAAAATPLPPPVTG